jgi:hypothetical protein
MLPFLFLKAENETHPSGNLFQPIQIKMFSNFRVQVYPFVTNGYACTVPLASQLGERPIKNAS